MEGLLKIDVSDLARRGPELDRRKPELARRGRQSGVSNCCSDPTFTRAGGQDDGS